MADIMLDTFIMVQVDVCESLAVIMETSLASSMTCFTIVGPTITVL